MCAVEPVSLELDPLESCFSLSAPSVCVSGARFPGRGCGVVPAGLREGGEFARALLLGRVFCLLSSTGRPADQERSGSCGSCGAAAGALRGLPLFTFLGFSAPTL